MGAARLRLVGGAPASVTKLWEAEEVEVEVLLLLRQQVQVEVRFEHKVESVDNQIAVVVIDETEKLFQMRILHFVSGRQLRTES